jgi:hypothetical protein
MLTASRRWFCDSCQTDIKPGQSFDIVSGQMFCESCINNGRHLENNTCDDLLQVAHSKPVLSIDGDNANR